MNDLLALPSLRELLQKSSFQTKRKWGQNFLLDTNITDKIARSAGTLKGRTVIEVGPGPGGLTRSLLLAGAERVIAIEKDPECLSLLAPLVDASQGRLTLLNQDALTVDYRPLITSQTKIVANLPYNVGTPLLLKWLPESKHLENLTLMFQKEVALRLVAAPRTKDYGRLSVLTQWYTFPRLAFDLSPKAFTPPPKVTSSVVILTPHPSIVRPVCPQTLELVLKYTFHQRRKMLRSSLKKVTPSVEKLLEEAGLDPTQRPEDLSVDDFCSLAQALKRVQEKS